MRRSCDPSQVESSHVKPRASSILGSLNRWVSPYLAAIRIEVRIYSAAISGQHVNPILPRSDSSIRIPMLRSFSLHYPPPLPAQIYTRPVSLRRIIAATARFVSSFPTLC
ncbi:hypothetical protein L249_4381 [Ophiocordyceps polyrhachis-furcata BCC 54312]|uniref:Uncharacterized protein n=1 Tax=Ophiocordyceps polyrhachis-furcata BCC 54312 TaxID=1330021 RepID=A0A367L860_9HYPO|nr:hypothetical protein L249_4381 [Ophiocordyceps polyrhachis-furcata BCC 54312]